MFFLFPFPLLHGFSISPQILEKRRLNRAFVLNEKLKAEMDVKLLAETVKRRKG